MKKITTILFILTLASSLAWSMPSQITFQGTLKQDGVPANATENMQFTFVDGTGANIPGTSPISVANVQVTNGLFAVQLPLDPTIPWEQYTPFIQVSVQEQILSPNQPINANLFAVAAIPQGMIALFAAACPTGWTRFSQLDNAFPMGGATYGATGGSATASTSHGVVFGSGQGSGSATASWIEGDPTFNNKPVSILPPYVTMVYCQKV